MKNLWIVSLLLTLGCGKEIVKDQSHTSGLIAYFPFDGNLLDASGNGNTGNAHGRLQFDHGKKGEAVRFNGKDSYVEVQNSPSLRSVEAEGEMTISCWINIREWSGERQKDYFPIVCKKNLSTDNDGWEFIVFDSNGVNLVTGWGGESNGYFYQSSRTTFSFNRWYHIVCAFSQRTQKMNFYVDGSQVAGYSYSDVLQNTGNSPLYIGFSPIGWKEFANGAIDDLKIFNVMLSESIITELFRQ